MTYCTTKEARALAGISSTATISDGDLTSIIEQADREVDAYLAPYGLTASATGAMKAASIKFTTAALIEYLTISASRGYTAADMARVDALRLQARELLEQYVSAQSSLSNSKKIYCRRVDGQ